MQFSQAEIRFNLTGLKPSGDARRSVKIFCEQE